MSPDVSHLLQFFRFDHLPPHLRAVSEPFAALANDMASRLDGPELVVGLRKLLESKDCCVRAALSRPTRAQDGR